MTDAERFLLGTFFAQIHEKCASSGRFKPRTRPSQSWRGRSWSTGGGGGYPVLLSIGMYYTVLNGTRNCILQLCIVLYCTEKCRELHFTALYCTVCTIFYCTILHYTVLLAPIDSNQFTTAPNAHSTLVAREPDSFFKAHFSTASYKWTKKTREVQDRRVCRFLREKIIQKYIVCITSIYIYIYITWWSRLALLILYQYWVNSHTKLNTLMKYAVCSICLDESWCLTHFFLGSFRFVLFEIAMPDTGFPF